MRIKTFLYGTSLSALALIPVSSANAADAQSQPTAASAEAARSESSTLEDIIVTAERRSVKLQDIPVAITALSEAQLKTYVIRDALDLQAITPGLNLTRSSVAPSFFLRGVGSRLSAPGLESSVATYIDNRYISRDEGINVDVMDLARIEVLKGPQGTFFGRNATGGAVRFITNDPTHEFEGKVTGTYGNYEYTSFTGVLNIPLADNLAVRFAAQKNDNKGYIKVINPGPGVPDRVNNLNTLNIRGKLKWDISDQADLLITGSYYLKKDFTGTNVRSITPPQLTGAALIGANTGPSYGTAAISVTTPSRTRIWATEAVLSLHFDGFDAVSTTTYSDQDAKSTIDGDATDRKAQDIRSLIPAKAFSQELRAQSTGEGRLKWTAGAYYFHEKDEHETVINDIVSLGRGHITDEIGAVFGQVEWKFVPSLTLIVGGRYTSEKKSALATRSTTPGILITATPGLPYSDSETWNKFTPRVTLQYHIGEQMLYATYSRGFKSGGFNFPYIGKPVLKPEVLDNYEIGAKGDFLNHSLSYDISAYYYDFKNLQVLRSDGMGGLTAENATNAEIYGIDLGVNWRVAPFWLIGASGTLLHSEYKGNYKAFSQVYNDYLTPNLTPPARGLSFTDFQAGGHQLLGASKYSFSINSRWDIPIGDGKFPIVVNYSYKSAFPFGYSVDPRLDFMQDGYGLLNGSIGYEPDSGKWSISVWGKNLTKQKYYYQSSAGTNTQNVLDGDPRTYGVTASFEF